MTSRVNTKVRLVRCPKCRHVLAELPDVPLYKCGGCGTVLLAKNRQPEANINGSSSRRTDSIAESLPAEAVNPGSSSRPITGRRPEVETSLDKVKGRTRCYEVDSSQDGSFSDKLRRNSPEDGKHVFNDETEREDSERAVQKGSDFVAKNRNLLEHGNRGCVSGQPVGIYSKDGSFCTYYGSESSYEGNFNQILRRPRKNKGVDNAMVMVGKNGYEVGIEPERSPSRNTYWTQPWLDAHDGFRRVPFTSGASSGPIRPSPAFKKPGPGPDKRNLLRTVCELQNQLSRMQFPEIGMYDEPFLPKREMYSDVCRPCGYDVRQCSCPHCFPGSHQDWRHSVQLPLHGPAGRTCGPRSEQVRHLDEEISSRARLNGKYLVGKRHLRPLAGGAPVAACYSCSELLRLPEDFLVSGRGKHRRLTCGACGTRLRFLLSGGTHIAPHRPSPPPGGKMKSILSGARAEGMDGPSSSSPLHRLMGYSSPSHVLDN